MAVEESQVKSTPAQDITASQGAAVLPYKGGKPKSGFFTIVKKKEGKWTRLGTLFAALLLSFLIANYVHTQLEVARAVTQWAKGMGPWTTVAIATAVFALLMLWAWTFMNKPSNVDFLIATDSEMKKVNWTTRKELIGSTRVVIFFVILISLILFLMDLAFGYLFYLLGVLEVPPF